MAAWAKRAAFALMLGCLAASGAPLASKAADDPAAVRRDQLWQFIDDVLLRYWIGETQEAIRRWTRRPTLSLATDLYGDEDSLRGFVSEINAALVGTEMGIDYVGQDDGSADIVVFVALKDDFETVAKRLAVEDLSFVENAKAWDGFSLTSENEIHAIESALIVLAAEATGERRRAVILRELLYSLGFRGYSMVFPESARTITPEGRRGPARFPTVDKKLLRFLYQDLNAGDTWVRVREAFDRRWPK